MSVIRQIKSMSNDDYKHHLKVNSSEVLPHDDPVTSQSNMLDSNESNKSF